MIRTHRGPQPEPRTAGRLAREAGPRSASSPYVGEDVDMSYRFPVVSSATELDFNMFSYNVSPPLIKGSDGCHKEVRARKLPVKSEEVPVMGALSRSSYLQFSLIINI